MPEFYLDAYAVRSCPLKTLFRFHPDFVKPSVAPAPSPNLEAAQAFDAEILGIFRSYPGAVDCSELGADESLAVLRSGVPIAIRPLLLGPGHRRGRIDLAVLVGREETGQPQYLPVEIKFHRLVEAGSETETLAAAPFSEPSAIRPRPGWRFRWAYRVGDLLHISHDWRLLADLGLADPSQPRAGLIAPDTEGEIVWLDLTAPVVRPNPEQLTEANQEPGEPVTILARYDHEYDFRVSAARAGLAAAAEPPLISPIVQYECSYCPWWAICRPMLADDDLSLVITKARFDLHEIRVLRSLGLGTAQELAAADLEEILPKYLPLVSHREGTEERLRLAQHRCQLRAAGVLLERTTSGPISLPKRRIEIDFDIETSAAERVYLWGFYVDDGENRPYYQEFSRFTELDDGAEIELAVQALGWLRGLVADQPVAEVAIYHYSSYELVQIRRLAAASQHPDLQWAVAHSELFVDLFPVVKANFFGVQGLGLKVLASDGAGYAWRDTDPGGLNSISWFDEAISAPSPAEREAARLRVLEYNEDDVRATRALRRWLRGLS